MSYFSTEVLVGKNSSMFRKMIYTSKTPTTKDKHMAESEFQLNTDQFHCSEPRVWREMFLGW